MDRIFLSGIKVFGFHGLTEEERALGQVLEVDVELRMDLRHAGRTDVIEHTADWTAVFALAQETVAGGSHHLLESLAHDLARQLLDSTRADEVMVRVTKPYPPVGGICNKCGVEVVRTHSDYERDSQ